MRSIVFILFILALGLSCKKDLPAIRTCGKTFYYYQDTRIYLHRLADQLMIGFTDTLTNSQITGLLNKYSAIKTPADKILKYWNAAVIELKPDLECGDVNNVIAELKKDQRILYANPLLRQLDNQNITIWVTDEFIVALNDTNDLSALQSLADQTQTSITGRNKYSPEIYYLSTSKSSGKNALEMANYFHEIGMFKFSAPNFHYMGKFY